MGIIFDAEPFMRTFNAYSHNMAVAGVQGQDFNQAVAKKKVGGTVGDKIGDFLNPVLPSPKPSPKPNDDEEGGVATSDPEEEPPLEIVDCEMGEWEEWSECYCDDYGDSMDGSDCKRYEQRRWRDIITYPTYYQGKLLGKECDDFVEKRECPPKDCVIEWGDWSEWSECTQVEGDDGTQERSRSGTITQEAQYGGKSCEEVYNSNDDTFMVGSGQATHKQTRSCEYKTDEAMTVAGGSTTSSSTFTMSNYSSKLNNDTVKRSLGRIAMLGLLVGGSWFAYENRETIGKQIKTLGE